MLSIVPDKRLQKIKLVIFHHEIHMHKESPTCNVFANTTDDLQDIALFFLGE